MVGQDTPVALCIMALPPAPIAFASVAHHIRIDRSFNNGCSAVNFSRKMLIWEILFIILQPNHIFFKIEMLFCLVSLAK